MNNRQITYCTNIHPGESWSAIRSNQDKHVLYVKERVSPESTFPLGLRLSARAANEMTAKDIDEFRQWNGLNRCFPITLNGFPYGDFHDVVVKQSVYDPDWRSEKRVAYTCRLAEIFAAWWVDENECSNPILSISTVPIAFKSSFAEGDWPVVYRNIIKTLSFLERLYEASGVKIVLALEPEPSCVLEQTTEVVEFFSKIPLPSHLRSYLGVCLDCCHQAVEFEQAKDVIEKYRCNDIFIAKVQVSSALRARNLSEIQSLVAFDEPTYLHQSILKNSSGELLRFVDLPDMASYVEANPEVEECRVHFHVPIFLPHLGALGTTQEFITELIPLLNHDIPLEVETYSFSVLPKKMQLSTVDEAIVREINWLKGLVNASHCST